LLLENNVKAKSLGAVGRAAVVLELARITEGGALGVGREES
jgi:hypothetical protein